MVVGNRSGRCDGRDLRRPLATRVGMSTGRVAVFVGATMLGSVALQWPIGAMSDRMRRRSTLLLVTAPAAGVAAAASALPYDGVLIVTAMFLIGGLTFPMYSLSLSHINDVIPRGQAVSASSIFVFVNRIGGDGGPAVCRSSNGGDGAEGVLLDPRRRPRTDRRVCDLPHRNRQTTDRTATAIPSVPGASLCHRGQAGQGSSPPATTSENGPPGGC
ncbi:MAG: MFS transporter [Acidimicrobiia bacterium]